MSGGAIYGSDSIGADLSEAYDTADMKGPSGNGIAGAGITDFGDSSVGAQMRAGMAGGRRRRRRSRMMGGTSAHLGELAGPQLEATMAASGGRRRRHRRSMRGGIASTLSPSDL